MTARKIENILKPGHALGIAKNKPRIAYDNVEYLNPSSIAAGLVDHIEIDPTEIKDAFENPNQDRRQQSQDLLDKGTLGHRLLLQPDLGDAGLAIWTGKVRNGLAWDQFEAEHAGQLIMRKADVDRMREAVKAYRFNKRLNEIVTDCDVEVGIFSREGNIHVKGLMDAVTKGDCCNIIDPKFTTAGLGYHTTNTTIRTLKYREKMAAYKRWLEQETGREVIGCYNIFFSMDPPYRIRIKKMSTQALEWGEQRILAAIDEVRRCLDSGKWPMFVKEDIVTVENWEKADSETEVTFGGVAL